DNVAIAPRGNEADVLAVVLVGNGETEPAGKLAGLRLGHIAERKAQEVELLARGGKQEIALIALRLARLIKRPAAAGQRPRDHVVAGCQDAGAKLARGCEKIAELDRLIALHARNRRLAGNIALGKAVDHRLLEAVFVVEHVMGNANALGDRTRVIDVLPG